MRKRVSADSPVTFFVKQRAGMGTVGDVSAVENCYLEKDEQDFRLKRRYEGAFDLD